MWVLCSGGSCHVRPAACPTAARSAPAPPPPHDPFPYNHHRTAPYPGPRLMITVLHWDSATRCCRPRPVEELPPTAAGVAPDDVWWVDLSEPTPGEEDRVFGTFFPVHPLTREDITRVRAAEDRGAH